MIGLEYFRAIWCVGGLTVRHEAERRAARHVTARELRSGKALDIPEPRSAPPIALEDRTLIVTFDAASLLEALASLGWQEPPHVIDLFAEYRAATNGLEDRSRQATEGPDLRKAAEHFGLPKDGLLAPESFDSASRPEAGYHCRNAVAAMPSLLARVLHTPYALRRGAYAASVAAMQHRGIPMERSLLERARELNGRLQDVADQGYRGLFSGNRIRERRLRAWAARRGYPWPCPQGARLSIDRFFHWYRAIDELARLDRLRKALRALGGLAEASVTAEGRSHCDIRPFAASTGRNQPSRRQYAWETPRPLISPPSEAALAIIDYAQQEIGIAAYLSGDPVMIRHYETGDAFINFGLAAGLADPASASARKEERKQIKKVLAPIMYGAGPASIATRLGRSTELSADVVHAHRRIYQRFWQWRSEALRVFNQGTPLETLYGWRRVPPRELPADVDRLMRSAANFPVQAHGTEILWAACRRIHASGIRLVGVLHDAVLIEAPAAAFPDTCASVQQIMKEAALEVLPGPLRTAVQVAHHPDQFSFASDFWAEAFALAGEHVGTAL
jgi:DNA polymerase-1